ncbi:conserved hypothetical protein [Ricinus communis]|uniref:Uncharacterized protein n=1 Tax=Ricinus communis TaxID=3988 RepID=B9SEU9_RICCO|nr:conserved hypothetical protein [Ricinus communis]
MTGWIGLKLTDKELLELTYLKDQVVPLQCHSLFLIALLVFPALPYGSCVPTSSLTKMHTCREFDRQELSKKCEPLLKHYKAGDAHQEFDY